MSARALIGLLYPPGWHRKEGPPDGHDDVREVVELLAPPESGKAPNPVRLGRELGKHNDRTFGDVRLVGAKDRIGTMVWRAKSV